jgi:signal peptidase I
MTERSGASARAKGKGGFGETFRTLVYAILIALGIRSVAFEPFNIPSGSMLPTLLVGDYLFVSKYSYGYSKHSLPLSPPLFSGRIFFEEPERGDIVVFKWPGDNATDYIKRVIGLPGDRIQMRDSILYINDRAVPRESLGDAERALDLHLPVSAEAFRETLPNGRSYVTLDLDLRAADNSRRRRDTDNTGVYVVPAGHYFMMGDNRDDSSDSRIPLRGGVGFVPAENLVGRAEVLFFSTPGTASFWEVWKWRPDLIRFSRFFTTVK